MQVLIVLKNLQKAKTKILAFCALIHILDATSLLLGKKILLTFLKTSVVSMQYVCAFIFCISLCDIRLILPKNVVAV